METHIYDTSKVCFVLIWLSLRILVEHWLSNFSTTICQVIMFNLQKMRPNQEQKLCGKQFCQRWLKINEEIFVKKSQS